MQQPETLHRRTTDPKPWKTTEQHSPSFNLSKSPWDAWACFVTDAWDESDQSVTLLIIQFSSPIVPALGSAAHSHNVSGQFALLAFTEAIDIL